MEDNKENYARRKTESRIALPVDHLPPFPNQRAPLKPINSQGGASTGTRYPPKLDKRHVTKRKQSDDEIRKDTSVVIISSDEEEVFTGITETVHEQNLEVRPSTSKDTSEGLVKNDVKMKPITTEKLVQKVGKEVQYLSPACKVRRFVCPPTQTVIRDSIAGGKVKSLDQLYRKYSLELTQDLNTDLLRNLQSVEEMLSSHNGTRALLNWLMQLHGPNEDPGILQTAIWYLDKSLQIEGGVKRIDVQMLVATACYWIAQKLYHRAISASSLVMCVRNSFTITPDRLAWAEKVLLFFLNFPSQPVIPNDFIVYFASWCDPEQPGDVEEAATFLYMAGAVVSHDSSLDYPSSVAAAAVRNAVLLLKKPDSLDKLLNCPEYKSAEAKARNFSALMSSQRVAARTVAEANYAYSTPFDHYGAPPTYIAQKIVKAAGALATKDSINSHTSYCNIL